jgi:CTP synthase (UTP-ammonia lyase)
MREAAHAEEAPGASMHLLTPVACPLPGRGEGAPLLSGADRVIVREGSRLRAILGVSEIDQEYFCSYEPNPAYRELFERGDFRICAETVRGEIRAAERAEHPFFIGVLFQPQRTSRPEVPHPLIAAFVRASGGG